MNKSRHLPTIALTSASLFALVACSACGSGDSSDDSGSTLPANTHETVATYAQIVHASYEDSLAAAKALATAVDTLVASPSEENLNAARQAWIDSREPYLQTEVYRFYDGPIDHPETGPEGLMNAWPMNEAYVDYVVGPDGQPTDDTNLINDTSIVLDAETLEGKNEAGAEDNIATGYHAIEFLLWGQDLSADGPGARPYTDFVTDGSGTATDQDRRGTYLKLVAAMLVGHLEGLVADWSPEGTNYRSAFVAEEPLQALGKILTGMVVLSGFETGGERLQTAHDSGDQEDEHSCFSDNTHRDMVQDVQGVLNVWNGTYGSVQGPGVKAVVEQMDAALAATVDQQIAASLSAANALRPPFDQELLSAEGKGRIMTLIDALFAQKESLEQVFVNLGLSVPDPS